MYLDTRYSLVYGNYYLVLKTIFVVQSPSGKHTPICQFFIGYSTLHQNNKV